MASWAQSLWVPHLTFSPHCPSNVGGQSDPAAEDLAMDPHLPLYKIKELDYVIVVPLIS